MERGQGHWRGNCGEGPGGRQRHIFGAASNTARIRPLSTPVEPKTLQYEMRKRLRKLLFQRPHCPQAPQSHRHEEISNDYRDMIYTATRQEIEAKRTSFLAKVTAQMPRCRRQPRGGWRQDVHVHALPAKPIAVDPHEQRRRAIARRSSNVGSRPKPVALRRDGRDAVLGVSSLRADHHAQG
jgi:hypothetical protein